MPSIGELVAGEIEAIAFGGHGILRHQNLVIFVPFSSPGDRVEVIITRTKKRFAQGEIVRLIEPSKNRIEPRCPYYGSCGGCQFQHIPYPQQLEIKAQFIKDSLTRIAKIDTFPDFQVLPAKAPWAYRRHITLKVVPHAQHFIVGYVKTSNDLLPSPEQCPIFSDHPLDIMKEVSSLLSELHCHRQNHGRLTILKNGKNGWSLHLQLRSYPRDGASIIENHIAKHPSWKGFVFTTEKETKIWGQPEITLPLGPLQLKASPLTFIQNHPEQSHNLYKELLHTAGYLKPASILDLYCGYGSSSLLLAKKLKVPITAVEWNGEAIRLAKENAAINELSSVDFLQKAVENVIKELLEKTKPEMVVVNPPRIGLHPRVLETLRQYKPAHVVYISCLPSTLARDVRGFVDVGYTLTEIKAFDMFPQTTHVETLAHLSF